MLSGIEELGRETTGPLEEGSVRQRFDELVRASDGLKKALAATPRQVEQAGGYASNRNDERSRVQLDVFGVVVHRFFYAEIN